VQRFERLERFKRFELHLARLKMIGSGTLTKQIARYLARAGYEALNDGALRATKDHTFTYPAPFQRCEPIRIKAPKEVVNLLKRLGVPSYLDQYHVQSKKNPS
jgi:hypothetical protein